MQTLTMIPLSGFHCRKILMKYYFKTSALLVVSRCQIAVTLKDRNKARSKINLNEHFSITPVSVKVTLH